MSTTYTSGIASDALYTSYQAPASLLLDGIDSALKDIVADISNISGRIGILESNSLLESRWAELKALGDSYRKLEAELLSREKTINALTKG